MDIAVVGVGSSLVVQDGVCREARIALGAVGPTPLRAAQAEGVLVGKKVTPDLIDAAAKSAVEAARPIDDVRGSAAFRKQLVEVLTRRTLTTAWQQASALNG
jgi:carbon-monoxide dehydrogenase medium subunit